MDSKSLSENRDQSKVQMISSNILSRIESVGVVLSAVFIVITMLLTTLDVVLRYIFSSPIQGVYELESMMLVAIAYLGLSYIQSKRSHVAMDVLSANVHGPGKLVLNLLNDVIFLLIGVLFTWQMGISTLEAWQIGDIYPGSLKGIPIWPA